MENQKNPLRQWFWLTSQQIPVVPQTQPKQGTTIFQAPLTPRRAPLLSASNMPLQSEQAKTQISSSSPLTPYTQFTTLAPSAMAPYRTASPASTTTLQSASFFQPSSPTPSRSKPTNRTATLPESPKMVRSSLQASLNSSKIIIQPPSNIRPILGPQAKTLPVTALKNTILLGNSEKDEMNFNSGKQETKSDNISRLLIAQSGMQNIPSSPNKEASRPTKQNRIITIAGENIGVSMDLGSTFNPYSPRFQLNHPKGKESESGSRDYKSNEEILNTATKSNLKFPLANSNVQCVNNSLMFDASTVYEKPGVHVTFKPSLLTTED